MKYITSKGEAIEMNCVSTPHLFNAMKKRLNSAELRKMKHLFYATMLNPLLILNAPDLIKYCSNEFLHIRQELERRGHSEQIKTLITQRERQCTSLVLVTNYLHNFGIMERAKAYRILIDSANKAYKELTEEQETKNEK